MAVARSMSFKLAVIYEGLTSAAPPCPRGRSRADLQMFLRDYAADPVFRIFDKPLVIWSGTWKFSAEDIERVTRPAAAFAPGARLGEEPAGLRTGGRAASTATRTTGRRSTRRPTPATRPSSRAMSDTVHRSGGRWIAPFAPGFDARLVGGTREVPRRDGATLRQEYAAAVSSSPDALGLISWNEFSENTHVEPSRKNGDQYLSVLSALSRGGEVPVSPLAEDSSAAAGGGGGGLTELLALGGFAVLLLLVAGVHYARRDRTGQAPAAVTPYGPAKPPRRRLASYLTWRRVTALGVVAGVVVTGATVDTVRQSAQGPDRRTPFYLGAQPVKAGGSVVVAAAGDIACPADRTAPRRGAHPAGLLPHAADGRPADVGVPGRRPPTGGQPVPGGQPEGLPGVVRQDLGAVSGHHLPRARQPRVRHTGRLGVLQLLRCPRRRAGQGLLQLRPRRLARRRAELRVPERRWLRSRLAAGHVAETGPGRPPPRLHHGVLAPAPVLLREPRQQPGQPSRSGASWRRPTPTWSSAATTTTTSGSPPWTRRAARTSPTA